MNGNGAPIGASVPNLAIWHLLLWMLCVALAAAGDGAHREASAAPQSIGQQALAGVSLALWGIPVAGFVLAVLAFITGSTSYPRQAGHWLLTLYGLVLLGDWVFGLAMIRHIGPAAGIGKRQMAWNHAVMGTDFTLITAACVGAAVVMHDTLAWRLRMLAEAMLPGFWAMTNAVWLFSGDRLAYAIDRFGMTWQSPVFWTVTLSTVPLAVIDIVRRKPRDWLHWTGVVSTVIHPFFY